MQPEKSARHESTFAGLLCVLGVLFHIGLSDPLLNMLGVHYSGPEGAFYEKIHPGTVCYFLAFLVLLCSGNPVARLIDLCRQNTAFMTLLFCDPVLFFYMGIRSGFAGLAFMIDTHMSAAICAVILSHTPVGLCRKLVGLFIAAALINAVAGIAESFGHFRIFSFDPDWVVLHEQDFR